MNIKIDRSGLNVCHFKSGGVQEYVERHLLSGTICDQRIQPERVAAALGRLLDALADKDLLTARELTRIVEGVEQNAELSTKQT